MSGKGMPHRSLRREPPCAQRSPPQRKTLRGRNIFRGKGYNLHQTMRRRVKSLTALGALLLIATVHLMPEGFHIHIMETAGGGWHVTSIACPNESPLLAPGTTREISPLSRDHQGHLLFCSTREGESSRFIAPVPERLFLSFKALLSRSTVTATPRETLFLFTHRSQAPPSALPSLRPTLRI